MGTHHETFTRPFELIDARAKGTRHWIAVTARGVRAVSFPRESREAFLERVRGPARLGALEPGCAGALARAAARGLVDRVERNDWSARVPLDLVGSELARAVWSKVAAIPPGSRMTLSAIAAAVGRPGAHRAVGAINRRTPAPPFVPHHRVVNAKGELMAPPGDPWSEMRETLWRREGEGERRIRASTARALRDARC